MAAPPSYLDLCAASAINGALIPSNQHFSGGTMLGWKLLAAAGALSCAAGIAQAQDAPQALPKTPKLLTAPASGQFDGFVEVVATDKGFLLGWNRTEGSSAGVLAQSFSSRGRPLKDIATIKGSATGVGGMVKFANLGGGKVGAVWQNLDKIEAGVFSVGKNRITGVRTIGTANNSVHDIVRLADGKVALVTLVMDVRNPDAIRERVMLYTLDSRMRKLTGPKPVNGAGYLSTGTSFDHTVVDAESGGFVVFRNRETTDLFMRAFSSAGDPQGPTRKVNTTALPTGSGVDVALFNVKAVRLTNNNILVTWTSLETPPSGSDTYDIRARLFGPTGAPLGNDFRVNTDVAGTQFFPRPVALPDGAFAILYLSDRLFVRDHFVRTYRPNGKPAGRPKLTQTANASTISMGTAVARLSDGSLVHAFHDAITSAERIMGDGIPASQVGGSGATPAATYID
jgi:hypothetical protein